MFSNLKATQYISFATSYLGQINNEVLKMYLDSIESIIPLPIKNVESLNFILIKALVLEKYPGEGGGKIQRAIIQ